MRLPASVSFTASIALLALAPATHAQEQLWLTQFGTIQYDFAADLAPDSSGGVYLCGHTSGDLGGLNAGPTWTNDAFLARYDRQGRQVWIRQYGTVYNDRAIAVAPDGAGGVFVTGPTGAEFSSEINIYLARYNQSGERLWSTEFGSREFEYAAGLAADGLGGVFICGRTRGEIGGLNAGGLDGFVGRFDSQGNQLWIVQFGGAEHDWANALALDDDGGVFVAGSIGSAPFGPMVAFVARYDKAGTQMWFAQFGAGEQTVVVDLAPDGRGGVFLAGGTDGSLGGPNLGEFDAFVARFDQFGRQVWMKQFGTSRTDGAYALTPDGDNGVLVGGLIDALVGGLLDPIVGDAYLARYDSAGEELWLTQFGTRFGDYASGVARDKAGGVFVAGITAGSLGRPNEGENDIFLARYTIDTCYADCDGNGVLDIFDFLCFQNSFVLGETYACDCDPDPVCDIFDFLCFQNAFVGGCP